MFTTTIDFSQGCPTLGNTRVASTKIYLFDDRKSKWSKQLYKKSYFSKKIAQSRASGLVSDSKIIKQHKNEKNETIK